MTPRDPRPDPRQALLLRAALLDGDDARAAWRAWRAGADLDRLDQPSFRLLPLVHRNLERLGVDDPWSGRLRGFYRRAWAENQVLFRRVGGALAGLAREGIPSLVLKGAALASQAYRDAGARPMADADVLVPRRRFVAAVACLRGLGWSPDAVYGPRYDASPEAFRSRYHALGFLGDGDRLPALDLHDRPLQVYARHPVDFPEDRLWADAEAFDLGGTPALRPSPEHALVLTCFHGFQRQDVASIRWIPDADRLIRAQGPRLRWDRLIDDARRARVLTALRDALGYLVRELGTPVPAAALSRLRRTPVTLVDRLERAMRLGEPAILADYGKSLAPALRRARERGASRRLRAGAAVRTAYRLAVRLPKRHLARALGRALRRAAGDAAPAADPRGPPGRGSLGPLRRRPRLLRRDAGRRSRGPGTASRPTSPRPPSGGSRRARGRTRRKERRPRGRLGAVRAFVLERPGSLVLRDVPEPVPREGEILVRVRACGVCRTDLHAIDGDITPPRFPVVPGHQVVGTVVRGGRRFAAGDRVGIAWLRSTCGECDDCRAGRENLCRRATFTGFHADGGYAEAAVVPEDWAYAIPPALGDLEAAPLLCAGIVGFRALRQADVGPGAVLGLYGFGSSAHVALQVARHLGCRVLVVTRGEAHRALARELGAEWVGAAGERPPVPLDAAVVFAPAGEVLAEALEAVRWGGTVASACIHMSPIPPLDYARHLFGERTLRSTTANTRRDGEDLLAIAAQGAIRTHVREYAFDDAPRALDDVRHDRVRGSAVLRVAT